MSTTLRAPAPTFPSVPTRYDPENETQFRKILVGILRSALEYDPIRSGTATLLNGNTSIVVNHGLRRVPRAWGVTPAEAWGAAAEFWVAPASVTEDQLTITVDANPGADVDFRWWVQ